MRKTTVGISSVLLFAGLAIACAALFRIDSGLNSIRHQVSHEGDLPFTLLPLASRETLAIFQPLSTPSDFATGAAFAGKLYLAGPGGLAIYDNPHSPPRLLRPGLDLPPAPIVALAAGRLRGQPFASLIAATHGEGLLFFSADPTTPPQHLLPSTTAFRDITAVLPLATGDLLIGTRAGLLVYNGQTLRLFQPAFAHLAVTALAGDESDFWVGTRTRGVLHWHAGQLDVLDPASGLPDPEVNAIALGPQGVFIGTPLGIAQYTGGRFARTLAPGLFVRALALHADTLTVATFDQGLHTLSLATDTPPITPRAIAPPQDDLTAAAPILNPADADLPGSEAAITSFFTSGDTLLAVANGNVLRRGPFGSWQQLLSAPPQPLTGHNIAALSFSPDGRLWIGYFDRGLDVFDLHTNRVRHVEDDHIFCINRIVPDPQRHTMDVATANGLVLFDAARDQPVERQVLTRRDGLIADQVTDIAFSRDGMAVATPAGLTFFTASGAQSLYVFQGLANNHVYTLAAAPSSSRVFAGTLGGVSILDNEAISENVTLKNSGLKRNWVTAIALVPAADPTGVPHASRGLSRNEWAGESDPTGVPHSSRSFLRDGWGGESSGDRAGTWLVGTYGGSVVAMDAAGHITPLDTPAPQAVINPNAILATPRHLLAGSLDNGLLVYDQTSHRWSQVLAGLPSRSVTALAESNGELYIGTEDGIVRLAEAELP